MDDESLWELAKFHAPWREIVSSDPETGHITYGPYYLPKSPVTGSPVRYEQAAQEHAEGRYAFSGGLWDHSQDKTQPRKLSKDVERYDYEEVASYVADHCSNMPLRELEVYTHFWVEGRSYASTATSMGVAVPTVRELIRRIRMKVRK